MSRMLSLYSSVEKTNRLHQVLFVAICTENIYINIYIYIFSSVVEHFAYNARGREFESHSCHLFSRTFTFQTRTNSKPDLLSI